MNRVVNFIKYQGLYCKLPNIYVMMNLILGNGQGWEAMNRHLDSFLPQKIISPFIKASSYHHKGL